VAGGNLHQHRSRGQFCFHHQSGIGSFAQLQVNWVEQSGKSHYKAVIVTPEQAFKILMALPDAERVLTLLIAATWWSA
jgi:hypothetical protein